MLIVSKVNRFSSFRSTKWSHSLQLWLDLPRYWIRKQVWWKLWSLRKLEISLHQFYTQNRWSQCDRSRSLHVGWSRQSLQHWDKSMDQIKRHGWKIVVQHCSSRNWTQKHRYQIARSKRKNEKQRLQSFTCHGGPMLKGYVHLFLMIYLEIYYCLNLIV